MCKTFEDIATTHLLILYTLHYTNISNRRFMIAKENRLNSFFNSDPGLLVNDGTYKKNLKFTR